MSDPPENAFDVEIADHGEITISGKWAAQTLMRIVLAAKFQTGLNAEMLLSPYVNRLVETLAQVAPVRHDWSQTAVQMPPEFYQAAQVVLAYRNTHRPDVEPADLIREALRPHELPEDRMASLLSEGEGTITLWRPVGPKELKLIADTDFSAFPPRLPEQPIFYPVLNETYAIQIARDWNVKADGAGFVTRFNVRRDFMHRYPVQQAGGQQHLEYWIPAEDLRIFNDAIVGRIEVVAEFR